MARNENQQVEFKYHVKHVTKRMLQFISWFFGMCKKQFQSKASLDQHIRYSATFVSNKTSYIFGLKAFGYKNNL